MSYIIVEIVERTVKRTIDCDSLEQAVSMANRLLEKRLRDLGHIDEIDEEEYLRDMWNYATKDNLNAWCNFRLEYWDAHIIEVKQ